MTDADGEGARQRLERDADRLELVSRWADDLAHEIKNPLHAMVINLELVKRRATSGDAEDAVKRAEVVENELHRVHALVDSLLRLVRPWPESTAASVHEVFGSLEPVLRARCRIRSVTYQHDAEPAIAAVSPGTLAHVIVRLVDEAIAPMAEGDRLRTEVRNADDAIRIVLTRSGPRPAEDAAGVNLATTRRLLAEMGGSLDVAGAEDGEVEWILTLPTTGAA